MLEEYKAVVSGGFEVVIRIALLVNAECLPENSWSGIFTGPLRHEESRNACGNQEPMVASLNNALPTIHNCLSLTKAHNACASREEAANEVDVCASRSAQRCQHQAFHIAGLSVVELLLSMISLQPRT